RRGSARPGGGRRRALRPAVGAGAGRWRGLRGRDGGRGVKLRAFGLAACLLAARVASSGCVSTAQAESSCAKAPLDVLATIGEKLVTPGYLRNGSLLRNAGSGLTFVSAELHED